MVQHEAAEMVHVFPLFAFTGMLQCQVAFESIAAFVERVFCPALLPYVPSVALPSSDTPSLSAASVIDV